MAWHGMALHGTAQHDRTVGSSNRSIDACERTDSMPATLRGSNRAPFGESMNQSVQLWRFVAPNAVPVSYRTVPYRAVQEKHTHTHRHTHTASVARGPKRCAMYGIVRFEPMHTTTALSQCILGQRPKQPTEVESGATPNACGGVSFGRRREIETEPLLQFVAI
mmetsp:Transcript_28884/g.67809  ORF Transcript_28884/g.67809 Transcript_28884/m.67809 type:complete len:164 (+) Transcript_28884:535-1026(+)